MPQNPGNCDHSVSVVQTVDCANCRREFEADLWLIVDAGRRSDLVEHIRGGQLHELTCPHCGETGQIDAPLLVYRPDAEPPLLFSPARESSGEQNQEHAGQLVGRLRQSLGEAWREEWLAEALFGIRRELLPAVLSRDPKPAQRRIAGELGSGDCQEPGLMKRLWQMLGELRARLAGAMHSFRREPGVPAEFRADVEQAMKAKERYESRGDAAGLDAAAAAWERIVEHPGFVGSDARFQLGVLNNAGGVFLRRYWARGRLYDLERALALLRQGVQRTPPDSPDLPSLLNNLGTGLRDRYARTGGLEDLEEGRAAYERACERGLDLALEQAVRSGRNWGNWASERSDWEEAVTAYDHVFRAIDRLLRVQLLRSGWEAWLRETQGLAGRAAYALARDGRLEDAVVALERGRVRLLSESLEQNRRDVERLPELGHGHLLERYRQAAGRVQSLQQQAGEAGGLQGTLRESLEDARQELDAAIEAIRQVSGYEDLLLPPSFEKIRRAVTADAPLVYLVTTPQGSLALILAESVDVLWLDGFREEDLNRLLVEQVDDEVTGGYLAGQLGRSDWLQASLEKVLPLLAEKLMGPVAERLRGAYRAVQDGGSRNGNAPSLVSDGGATTALSPVPPLTPALSPEYRGEGVNTRPLVALIPTGRLSLLPLHATVLDEFAVSYAASAMAGPLSRDARFLGRPAGGGQCVLRRRCGGSARRAVGGH